jgi:catalase
MEIPSNFAAKTISTMTSNSNQMNPLQHPLDAIASGIQGATSGEIRAPRVAHNMSTNEGPADIIAKVSGYTTGGKREDDGPYFTNNEGIPIPDVSHSKNIGGIPLVSDVHLLQKQQTFNRSKNLESEFGDLHLGGVKI